MPCSLTHTHTACLFSADAPQDQWRESTRAEDTAAPSAETDQQWRLYQAQQGHPEHAETR